MTIPGKEIPIPIIFSFISSSISEKNSSKSNDKVWLKELLENIKLSTVFSFFIFPSKSIRIKLIFLNSICIPIE